jgi:hypothetical protein
MPNKQAAKEELDSYTTELKNKAGAVNVEITLSIRDLVLFWYVQLTWAQAMEADHRWIVGVLFSFIVETQ